MNEWMSVTIMASLIALAVGGVGLLTLRLVERRSLRAAALVPPITAVVGTAVGVAATAQAMFISTHDLGVIIIVCVVAGIASITVGTLMANRVRELEEQARQLAAQQARAEEAEEAEHTRRELVSWVSHDLRTPLAGLRAMAEALEDGVVDEPSRYHRQMILEVDRLSALVDDLFQLSRIQAGFLHLVLVRVSLPDVLGDVVAATEPLAAKRGVLLRASTGDVGTIRADEGELRRAITNLVTNAVRHTPHDGTVQILASPADEGHVTLSVIDECGGLLAEDMERLFDVGWRANSARTPEPYGGGGLGLAIVLGIVNAHQGQIAVDNVDGGCRFVMQLPVEPSPAASA
jgi:signal transduction histidine kinase